MATQTPQRLLAIGDIHGCYGLLQRLMDNVKPTKKDQLVFLGDYIDRGPYSQKVISELLQLQQDCKHLIFLKGNHEQMLLDFLADPKTIAQYEFRKITDLKRADYLVEKKFEPGMTYFAVMRIAMKLEEKAYKMYTKMAESAEKDDTTNLFLILAQEELKHKNRLETIYDDYLAKHGD